MKLYESTTSDCFYLQTLKSSTGWVIFREDQEPEEYNPHNLFSVVPSPGWVKVHNDIIEIPEEFREPCEDCDDTGIIDDEDFCHCKAGQRELNLYEGLKESRYMD